MSGGRASASGAGFVDIDWAGRPVRLEVAWVGEGGEGREGSDGPGASAPLIVFLHEGLGSVAMWRDFPDRLCRAVGARGLVYSRPGYGRSTPRAAGERWAPDFMHRQAHEVLPALRAALGLDGVRQPLWLFGHSDGGSIALLHAARPDAGLAGVIALAPHLFVEDVSVASIATAREAYAGTDLRARLAKYHDDPDSAFFGWNDIWLDPTFRAWNIEADIAAIRCPVLAMQGLDDEYGTLEQIRAIARRVPGTRLVEIPACGHSPHRDQPDTVIAAVAAFMRPGVEPSC
ncbi:MAG: alpha/beta hydrolase [Betaproteobacteria bacterium]|nr:alpha/beta hydrolase [Betaproteobacteria bacterium]MCC6247451.1 alpha/beta hydrolase [Rubrivivax sp.]MCL4700178.1 alpha/beta hydrolase [Burkholderiaceae bacterium]